ncbi:hypothetical protein NA57DRAFT_30390 [Rhizodiscina lignyota]|uniref:UspA domain-containing protein n=1 Tax=Rhizodiscina lignyota TaxID=1504668 RepID=A0A9P4MBF0_9PEZI|nr:hypothetical protein NA57DRAFT_30390 [Rhizodiscina lignyota]
MSLESALDEERREVIALLEGRPAVPRAGSRDPGTRLRAASPAGAGQSPVRSMLDIGNTVSPTARHASIAATGSGITSPTSLASPRLNPEEAYQFEMLPSIEHHALPKRVSQGGKKKGALASVFGSSSSSSNTGRARHNSTSGTLGSRRPMSPSSRLGANNRSESPAQRMLNNNSMNLMPDPNKYVSDTGKVIDMSSAYRRLSDAALLRSGGKLADLPTRKGSNPVKGESLAPDGSVRLEKDYYADDDDDEEALESSDEEGGSGGSDEEVWGSEKRRGRRRTRKKTAAKEDSESPAPGDHDGTSKKPKSLLAAAEEERKTTAYKYRSLLEPQVTVTSPDGEKISAKKAGIHPNTNFDMGGSGASTPVDSDTEADISDIHRAQRMEMNVSPILSTPESHRCLRQIIRGEYDKLQKEAEKGLRRQRMYLVATDLSDEAAYALEWTIGTVLRDGDTLLAVYAVDEELGTSGEGIGVGIGEGASMMRDTANVVRSLATEQKKTAQGLSPAPSPLAGVQNVTNGNGDGQPDFANMEKSERERWHACMEVSDRCMKLLRKTRLQCRVVIEVFHCKSPKHMITEVIDYLEPTLVVLGSRGRSALKGVLLGSFSNYLVTKSSVPVMVARKRLRKHSKYKRNNLRLSNMLTNPRGKLELAKID